MAEEKRYVDPSSGGAPQPGSWAGYEAATKGFGPPPPDLEEEPQISEYEPPGWTPEQDLPLAGREASFEPAFEGVEGDEEDGEEEDGEESEYSMDNTKEELQQACRDQGLDDSGTKQELLDRLNA